MLAAVFRRQGASASLFEGVCCQHAEQDRLVRLEHHLLDPHGCASRDVVIVTGLTFDDDTEADDTLDVGAARELARYERQLV